MLSQSTASPALTSPVLKAINLLPPPIGVANPIAILQQQVQVARDAGFTHAWLNPINIIPNKTEVHRLCLDTGLHINLQMSLYAPNSPLEVRDDMPTEAVKEWIRKENAHGNFKILIDFVWKHVSIHSSLLKTNKTWFGNKRIKDVIEYQMHSSDTETQEQIFQHLKDTARLFLDKKDGFGFDGLRIDSASHINLELRTALYRYIRDAFPTAIILEECLFDSNQLALIEKLAKEAEKEEVYSDFITSNLYYQKPGLRGELKIPSEMGDTSKLRLAKQHGISFTGNHDHFSSGWSIILTMAADRLVQDKAFMDKIGHVSTTALAADKLSVDKLLQAINDLNILNHLKKEGDQHQAKLPDELEPEQASCIRYLLPYANEIVREMLDATHPNAQLIYEFRLKLFERIANRTLPAQSGYFMLYSELISPFETQRIFFNRQHQPLVQLFLTIADLKENYQLTCNILEKILADKPNYSNAKNFDKAVRQLAGKKSPVKNKLKKGLMAAIQRSDIELRLWLPFIIEYLRNNPELNTYPCYSGTALTDATSRLQSELGTVNFIRSINELFGELTTPLCNQYRTFTAINLYKIFVRCSDTSTDIIILNLDPCKLLTINEMDMRKIALWHQARAYPPEKQGLTDTLMPPFNGCDATYIDDYAERWCQTQFVNDFHNSYTCITGERANHQTNLYLGLGINLDLDLTLKNPNFVVKKHVKSKPHRQNEAFTSPKRVDPSSRHTSPQKSEEKSSGRPPMLFSPEEKDNSKKPDSSTVKRKLFQ